MANCKPGDLAWIRRSEYAPCIGWLVEVVRRDGHPLYEALYGPLWVIRHRTPIWGQYETVIADSFLTPHRPGRDPEAIPETRADFAHG